MRCTQITKTHLNKFLHQSAITWKVILIAITNTNISPVQLHSHCSINTTLAANFRTFKWTRVFCYSIAHSNKHADYVFPLLMQIDACWQYSAHFTWLSHAQANPDDEIARAAGIDRWRESVDPPPQTLRTHSDGEDVMVQLTLHSSHGEYILDFLRLDSNLYWELSNLRH